MTLNPEVDLGRELDRWRPALRLGYVAVLLLATLSSFRFDPDPGAAAGRARRMLRPDLSPRDAIDGLRNVVLFAGWGLLWMATTAPGRSLNALRNAVLTGFGLSLSVEVAQLFSSSRTASVLDLATNTGGSLAGAILLVVMVQTLATQKGHRSFVGIPALVFALSTAVLGAGEAMVPLFRQEIQRWGPPSSRLASALDDVHWPSLETLPYLDLLLFAPIGAFCVAWLVETGRSYRGAAITVSAAGALAAAILEVAHGVLGIAIDVGAIVVHGVALAAGASAAGLALPAFSRRLRGAPRVRAITRAYMVWIALWALRPFHIDFSGSRIGEELARGWWIPLRALGGRVDAFSVVDVANGFFLYLPIGALFAVWPLRSTGVLAGIGPAVLLSASLELTQVFIGDRTLDVTDSLVQIAGALVGWLVARRAGFKAYGTQRAGR